MVEKGESSFIPNFCVCRLHFKDYPLYKAVLQAEHLMKIQQ